MKTGENNLQKLINGFQESLDTHSAKRARIDEGRITPIEHESASMALASKALLAQIEKSGPKNNTPTRMVGVGQPMGASLNNVQNSSKSSSNNIKDALEQLLSKRSNDKTEPTQISANN